MGRIYLCTRVIVIDEVPGEAESNTPYLDRYIILYDII